MATAELGLEITELRLGLPGGGCGGGGVSPTEEMRSAKKRAFSQIQEAVMKDEAGKNSIDAEPTVRKSQVVGWPPVCSYRRKNSFSAEESAKILYVKVSMDGAPFLRKINLSAQKDYSQLEMNLQKLFGSCSAALESYSSEYVPIYEDKDGDWMLVGDVPWTMFTESCKKLRIMKRTDAIGIGLPCFNGEALHLQDG